MPRQSSVTTLSSIINTLRSEWHKLTARIGDIEGTFKELGISHEPSSRRGRPPGRPKGSVGSKGKPGRRRKRRSFDQNAEQFVLGLLKGKKLGSAEINKAWKAAGRGGVANNSLTTLTKQKKIKRQSVKGARGGTYSVV